MGQGRVCTLVKGCSESADLPFFEKQRRSVYCCWETGSIPDLYRLCPELFAVWVIQNFESSLALRHINIGVIDQGKHGWWQYRVGKGEWVKNKSAAREEKKKIFELLD